MTENVIISIHAEQILEGQEPDVTELVTAGTLECDPEEGCRLSYQETELTGMEGTRTEFRVKGRQVTLARTGGVNSLMVFEEGARHFSMYETPFGALSVGVNTRYLRADLRPDGGELEIDYVLELNHNMTGLNMFHIQVRKAPKLKQ